MRSASDRRYEQRRLDRVADERRQEQRRQARLADERRQQQRRQDRLADERRQEERRQERLREDRKRDDERRERIAAENRRQDREDRKKSDEAKNDLAASLLRSGNVAAAAVVWDLNIGSPETPPVPGHRRIAPTRWASSRDWSAGFDAQSQPAEALPAPSLEMTPDYLLGTTTWTWTTVTGATGYVLQQAHDAGFSDPVEIYSGTATAHTATTRMDFTGVHPFRRYRALAPRLGPFLLGAIVFYRVKATGGATAADSPWSNVV